MSKDLLGHVSAIQHSENKASHVHLELCGCKIEYDQDLNFKLEIHIKLLCTTLNTDQKMLFDFSSLLLPNVLNNLTNIEKCGFFFKILA